MTRNGKELVTPGLFHAILVHEDESVVGKVRGGAVARGSHGVVLHELHRAGMRGEEGFDRPRMRLAWIGRVGRLQEREKLFTRADGEAVVRLPFDVGQSAARQLESNRHSARTGVVRVVRDEGVG